VYQNALQRSSLALPLLNTTAEAQWLEARQQQQQHQLFIFVAKQRRKNL
jgi:hypothetical protein